MIEVVGMVAVGPALRTVAIAVPESAMMTMTVTESAGSSEGTAGMIETAESSVGAFVSNDVTIALYYETSDASAGIPTGIDEFSVSNQGCGNVARPARRSPP